MRQNIFYLVAILFVVVFGTYYLVKDGSSTLSKRDRQFGIENPGLIDGLLLQRNDTLYEVYKYGNNWRLNNSMEVKPDAVQFLGTLFSRLKVLAVAPKQIQEQQESFFSDAMQLTLEQEGDAVLEVLIKGTTLNKKPVTLMRKVNKKKVFIVHVPALPIPLHKYLTFQQSSWRNLSLFNVKPDDIAKISVKYGTLNESFRIIRKKGGFMFESPLLKNEGVAVDAFKLQSYMQLFGQVKVHEFIDTASLSFMDALTKQDVLGTIELKTISGMHIQAQFTKKLQQDGNVDLNLGYVLINNSQLGTIKYLKSDPLLQPATYFLK